MFSAVVKRTELTAHSLPENFKIKAINAKKKDNAASLGSSNVIRKIHRYIVVLIEENDD